MMERREKIADALYGELSDGPDGEVHPYDERWYRAADRVLEAITDPRTDTAFDLLEDALSKGWRTTADGMVSVGDLGPLMDASRAVLMLHRGVEPIMPQQEPA